MKMKYCFLLLGLLFGAVLAEPEAAAENQKPFASNVLMEDWVDEPQDSIVFVNNSLGNVRKTLLYAGGGLLFSGIAGTAANAVLLSPYTSQVGGENLGLAVVGVYSLAFAMLPVVYGALSGGVSALIGALFPSDNPRYNTGNFYLGDRSGFTVIVDAVPLMMPSLNVSAGYHFDEHCFLGAGLGTYLAYHSEEYLNVTPFLDFRYSFLDERVTPYAGLNLGATMIVPKGQTPFEVYPSGALQLGARVRSNSEDGGDWWLGGSADFLVDTNHEMALTFLGFRVAYSF